MRALLLATLLAFAACARAPVTCDRNAVAPLSFASADDSVIVRTLGPSCDKAIGVLTITTEDGRPLYAWTAPLHPTFGNLFETRADGPSAETADQFLTRWAVLHVTTTADAPAWPARAVSPPGVSTTLDRDLYEFLRARELPLACHLSAVAHETCIYYEPAAAAASLFLDRDIPTPPQE